MALVTANRLPTRACRSSRVVTKCAFQPTGAKQVVGRRMVLGVTGFLPLLLSVPSSLALLLDEDDEDMVEKAKASRREKIASQKKVARQYMQESGFKDRSFETELVPVQKAVYKLAESGNQLESGNLSSVSATLDGEWLTEFKQAAGKFPGGEASAESIFSQIETLKSLASESDLKGSKQQFVSLVSAVQTWANDTGVAFKLQGL